MNVANNPGADPRFVSSGDSTASGAIARRDNWASPGEGGASALQKQSGVRTGAQGTGGPRNYTTLDLLRMVAAMLVVLYHYMYFAAVERKGYGGISDMVPQAREFPTFTPFVSAGWVGLQIFFVISGFVIVMSAQNRSAWSFARARILRLWPAIAFFSTLAFCAALAAGTIPAAEATVRFIRSVVLMPVGPWIDGVFWTLVTEAVFYTAIFMVLLFGQGHRIFALARIALLLEALLWAAVISEGALGSGRLMELVVHYRAQVSLVTPGCLFLLGIFAFESVSQGRSWRALGSLVGALACCLVSIIVITLKSVPVVNSGQQVWVPVTIWFAALAAAYLAMKWEVYSPVSTSFARKARTIGLMTFPLYLVHNISGGFLLGKLYEIGLPPMLAVTATIGACLAVSYIFATCVELRIRGALDRAITTYVPFLQRRLA